MPGRAPSSYRVALPLGRSITLRAEDALDGLTRHVPTGAADVVVTSPPYNVGAPYASYRDRRPRAEYLAWMARVGEAVGRALGPKGSFFLNVGGTPKDPWLPWDVAREVGRSFVLQNVILWVKSIAIDRRLAGRGSGLTGDVALGHYKPIVSDRYLHRSHEYVFHFSPHGDVPLDRLAIGVPYQDKSNIARWRRGASDLRCRGSTWFLPYATIRERERDRPHPATFPPELAEWCILLHGRSRTRLVVDPFVGIGSSAVAAARLDVDFIGFDFDRGYLRTAERRVRAELRPGRSGARPSARSARPARVRPP